MNSIKMDRLNLLDIVKSNRAKHVDIYNDALIGYKEKVQEILDSNAYATKKNAELYKAEPGLDFSKFLPTKQIPSVPVTYEKEYNRAVRMLELSVEETIDVEQDVFNQLVLDEFGWKNSFVASASTYSKLLA